jgi:hypothetical protein
MASYGILRTTPQASDVLADSFDVACLRMARRAFFAATLLAVLAGCATTPQIPESALRLTESSLEVRSMQTRTYTAKSENQILAAAVAVIQDMEYNLDAIEKPLGVLTASKISDADSGKEKAGLLMLDLLCVAGGSGSCNAMSSASDDQRIVMTMVVLPSLGGKDEYVARVTLQRIVFDKQDRVNLKEAIVDPLVYQQVFENLSKSLFLQANTEP